MSRTKKHAANGTATRVEQPVAQPMAKTHAPSHYTNMHGWMIRVEPAGISATVTRYHYGIFIDQADMSITEARDYAQKCLDRGMKKVQPI